MDNTHLHLILTHFPIIGSVIGSLLLLFGIWKKNHVIQEISLAMIIIMALIAIPVFLTGEPAEESVENLPGVIDTMIEEHEEAGELAFWVMIATGAISLLSIGLRVLQNNAANVFVTFSLILSLITTVLMTRTGYLGGQIRHSEIRNGDPSTQVTNQNGEENEEHDD